MATLYWLRQREVTDNLVDLLIQVVHEINVRAQRFKASAAHRPRYQPPFRYVTIYEVEGDSAEIANALREWGDSDRSSPNAPRHTSFAAGRL